MVTWNTDNYGYKHRDRIYQSHPYVLAVRKDGSSFGVIADTTFQLNVDLTSGITFSTKQLLNGEIVPFQVIIIQGRSPQSVYVV